MAVQQPSEAATPPIPPQFQGLVRAIHLNPPRTEKIESRFAPTDLPSGWDIARHPRVARLLRSRKFQFMLILPNQIIFWLVIFVGLLGTAIPGLNFGAAITWYVWFCLVFVMMVVVGRAWCVMCPFGGFGEWIQRLTFWGRHPRSLTLGLKMPEKVGQYGFLLSVVSFLILTWIEEFFNIAGFGPGSAAATGIMVLGIVTTALLFFLVFERRTFCRYICPLSSLIGTVGAMGSVAGFRTRDREVCLSCTTKDCMRGGVEGYGCPWYTWPGSADSNLACGLCSECYKACPSDNIGLFLQKPLTSVISPVRRRADVAWAVAILWGLVLFQQLNVLGAYLWLDNNLNRIMHWPGYPNPVDYTAIIALIAVLMAGIIWVFSRLLARKDLVVPVQGTSFVDRMSKFRAFFIPLMYGIIPIVGADYFARQLPKFFKHATRVIPSVGHLVGAGSTSSPLYTVRILSNTQIIWVQVAVIALGTLASIWAIWKITGRDMAPLTRSLAWMRIAGVSLATACGLVAGIMYVVMNAAS